MNLNNIKAIPEPIPIISAKIILYYIKQTQQSYPLIHIVAEIQRNVFTEKARISFKRHNQLNFDCAYTAQWAPYTTLIKTDKTVSMQLVLMFGAPGQYSIFIVYFILL